VAEFWFEPVVAKDSDSDAIAYGTSGQVFDPEDTGFENPLTVTLLSGSQTDTLSIGALGVTPEFMVPDKPRVVFKSGQFEFSLVSFDSMEAATRQAAADSQASRQAAEQAATAAEQKSLPRGGDIGQVPIKTGINDYEVGWGDAVMRYGDQPVRIGGVVSTLPPAGSGQQVGDIVFLLGGGA
jgi:hypothetical protein